MKLFVFQGLYKFNHCKLIMLISRAKLIHKKRILFRRFHQLGLDCRPGLHQFVVVHL